MTAPKFLQNEEHLIKVEGVNYDLSKYVLHGERGSTGQIMKVCLKKEQKCLRMRLFVDKGYNSKVACNFLFRIY